VNVTVSPVNDVPTVADDDAQTTAPNAVTISVLANDSDIDGDGIIVSQVTQPAHGSVVISAAQQSVTYTPTAGYFGPDQFTYTASDGNGGTATGTADVTVHATPNQAPDAVNDNATPGEDAGVVIQVLANDSDPNADALSVTQVSEPAHGTASINTGAQAVTYSPDANYHGADSFTYTISDGRGGSDVATVNPLRSPRSYVVQATRSAFFAAVNSMGAGAPMNCSIVGRDCAVACVASASSTRRPARGTWIARSMDAPRAVRRVG
jgi:hypothetical protein